MNRTVPGKTPAANAATPPVARRPQPRNLRAKSMRDIFTPDAPGATRPALPKLPNPRLHQLEHCRRTRGRHPLVRRTAAPIRQHPRSILEVRARSANARFSLVTATPIRPEPLQTHVALPFGTSDPRGYSGPLRVTRFVPPAP